MSSCCTTKTNSTATTAGPALQGDVDNVTACPSKTLTEETDQVGACCPANVPGGGYKPSIIVGVPEAEAANKEDGEGATTYYTTPSGFVWPGVDAGATIQVEDSSIFAAGQWVYILGYGSLEVVDIPNELSIYAVNRGTRGNADPGTVVPAGTSFTVAAAPVEEIPEEELKAMIDQSVEEQLPGALEEQIEEIPQWPAANVGQLGAGRLPAWVFDEEEGIRRLGYTDFPAVGYGPAVVRDPGTCGSESNPDPDVRLAYLKPELEGTGNLSVFHDGGATSSDHTPNQKALEPTDIDDQASVPSSFGFLAFSLINVTESYLRKQWHRVRKLIFPSSFIDTTTLADADQKYRIGIIQSKDGNSKVVELEPGANGEALVSFDGKWRLITVGQTFTYRLAPLGTDERTEVLASGGSWYNQQVDLAGVPEGASLVAISARVIYTLEADVGNNGNIHNPAAALSVEGNKVCNAYSIGEDSGGSSVTGSDTGYIVVPFDTTTKKVNIRVWKEGAAGTEIANRVTWEISQLGFYSDVAPTS